MHAEGTTVTTAIYVAGSRVSRLTTPIVNAFQTNPATRLFQVVSGARVLTGSPVSILAPERRMSSLEVRVTIA
jgi:hypothetical protein